MPGLARTRSGGFTMLEVLMVLVILGVLGSLAAPSMSQMIATNRVKGVASNLHVSMLKARSEAVKRNATVTLSPVGGDWADGWQIVAGGTTLAVEAAPAGVTITSTSSAVSYLRSGRISGTAPEFTIEDPHNVALRCVSVDLSGRPYVGQSC